MRDYIILNDQDSRDIQGLLIQSLPPITKPLMRTEIEEIDGRDGDIITDLGYAAYDRPVTIGLYGSYDIDAIIAFFNSTGTAVFSNESDKYYYYQIIEQIDFEKLIRFRTATINFHVQPFKYSTAEEIQVESGEENSITVINSGNYVAKPTITIYGSGTINLSLNGYQVFVINLGAEQAITIDTANLEAYNNGVLKNRLVTGNYESFSLSVGENTITWTGNITQISIENYSRWI